MHEAIELSDVRAKRMRLDRSLFVNGVPNGLDLTKWRSPAMIIQRFCGPAPPPQATTLATIPEFVCQGPSSTGEHKANGQVYGPRAVSSRHV